MRILLALLLSLSVATAGPRGSLDPRTASYSDRVYDGAGVAPTMLGRAQVAAFVQNYVVIGLWSNMVCWPLRSSQNAGTGTMVYSLGGLGTYNGTLVNGPTWGVDGVTFTAASPSYMTATGFTIAQPFTQVIVTKYDTLPGAGTADVLIEVPGTSNQGGSQFVQAGPVIAWFNGSALASSYAPNTNRHIFHGIAAASLSQTQFFVDSVSVLAPTNGGGSNSKVGVRVNGSGAANRSANQTCSATFLFDAIVPATSFASLYKSTIGQGLGLP